MISRAENRGATKSLPATPLSLIVRLQRPDDELAWEEFVDIYVPVIVGFLRSKGLQEADARDVTQETLRAVKHRIAGFDPPSEKGRFRNWLFVIVRSKLADHWRARKRQPQGTGDPDIHTALENVPDESDQSLWDREYEVRLFNWAANQIRHEFSDSTWRAFWMTAVEGRPAGEVAETLQMNVGNVYVCKSRVMARLRERIRQIEGE